MSLPQVSLKPGKDIPVLGGHPWIFSNALDETKNTTAIEPGTLVQVLNARGYPIAVGHWNENTSIRVRILSLEPEQAINKAFFANRFKALDTWKRPHLPADTNGYRVVHAESDGLPGLIVDRYNDVIVFQLHTYGMEQLRLIIIEALKATFSPVAIVERSDLDVRRIEGLKDQPINIHHGEITAPVTFMEAGLTFQADVLKGQKTGFFLDQREARMSVGKLAKGKRVLNLFGYSGAFSIHALKGGASFVNTVDVSHNALKLAESQCKLNNINVDDESKVQFLEADVFDFLQDNNKIPNGPYDLIICDPPAMAKSEKHLPQAMKAYLDLNTACLEALQENGILVTSSCSGRVTPEDFRDMLHIAAGRAGKDVRLLDWITQPVDHAERLSFPEGRYLKTAILQVTGRVPLAKPGQNR